LFYQFDEIFEGLKKGTDSLQVAQSMAVLNEIAQKINVIGQEDPELGNQLSLAHKERMEKLKLADLTDNLIIIQTNFLNFDTVYPTLQLTDIPSINDAIRLLNDISPKINSVGQINPVKGNDLAHAYNVRMKAVTLLGEKATADQRKEIN